MAAGQAAHGPACCTHRATDGALATPATNTAQSGAGAKRTDSITQTARTQETLNS
jgi:hypothetical protein